MNYGITPQGFIRKPFAVIKSEMEALARLPEVFGPDVDLTPTAPHGQWIALMALAKDQQWQLAEDVYYSQGVDTAEGVNLDRVVKLGFIGRKPEQKAIVPLVFTGVAGSPIVAGKQVQTAQGLVFETVQDVVVGSGGTVSTYGKCTVAGSIGIVPAGAVKSIKTPIAGVDSVINPDVSVGGRSDETDAELRVRYDETPIATGSSLDALISHVSSLASVSSVSGFENNGNGTDANGIPSKSYELVVYGGLDADIAATILSKGPAGIESYGNVAVPVQDSQGATKIVNFSRPSNVDIYINYVITKGVAWSDANLPTLLANAIKYVGGSYSGTVYGGVGIGKTIFPWKLESAQNDIAGIDAITAFVGRAPNPSSNSKLNLLPRERPVADATRINVVFA